MGLSGHFTRMWTWCGRCELFGAGFVPWVELSYKADYARFS